MSLLPLQITQALPSDYSTAKRAPSKPRLPARRATIYAI